MGKKQTYAKVMKDLTAKKAKYEAGLAEARRLNSASGINDYERRLTKLNAGMDELFQAQEASKAAKMAKGGMTNKQAAYATGGPLPKNMPPMVSFDNGGNTSTTRGGWTVYTVPNDGSYPGAFTNSRGEYVMLANKDGRVLPLNNEMAQHLDGDNPKHLFFKLDQGDYDNYINNYQSVDNPNVNPNATAYGDIGLGDMPATSSEMPMDLQEEFGYADPLPAAPESAITQIPAAPTPTGTAGVDYGMPNITGTTGTPTFTGVNMIPEAEVAASTNYAGAEPGAAPLGLSPISPIRSMGMESIKNKIYARPTDAMTAPTTSVADLLDPDAKAQSFRSKVEDAAMNVGGVGQNIQSKFNGMNPMTKQKLGMGMAAAAQFLPDIAAMRAMDRIEAPEDRPMERLQLMNADIETGRQLAEVENQSQRAMAAADRNVSNPAVAAAMKRANQRIAAGQKANILGSEAQLESQLRNQNMMLANENMNRNLAIDYGNRQQAVDFRNEKLAAKNRMRQQMSMKLGQVFGDFQNMNMDANRFNMLSKMYDPALMNRNDINWETMFGYNKPE